MVAAHSCCEPTLCSRSCNRGELAMVNAARKAMTMLMPIPARAFMPAGDLVDARHCASFSNPLGACTNEIQSYSEQILNRIRNTITNRIGGFRGWTAQRCCITNRPDDWRGENLFHCFWNSDDCRRSPWLR